MPGGGGSTTWMALFGRPTTGVSCLSVHMVCNIILSFYFAFSPTNHLFSHDSSIPIMGVFLYAYAFEMWFVHDRRGKCWHAEILFTFSFLFVVLKVNEGGTGGGRHGMKVGQGLRVQRREEILWEIWTRQCASLPGKAHVTDVTSTTELIKCVWKERGKTPC